jgi:hypothetical protein
VRKPRPLPVPEVRESNWIEWDDAARALPGTDQVLVREAPPTSPPTPRPAGLLARLRASLNNKDDR